jgi:glucose/arabinose dehydrogenase
MVGPTGYRVVLVNIDARKVEDFVHNTRDVPASRLSSDPRKWDGALERPIDVKFGPDGAMYVLDFGELEVKGGRQKVTPGTGRIFRMVGAELEPTTRP